MPFATHQLYRRFSNVATRLSIRTTTTHSLCVLWQNTGHAHLFGTPCKKSRFLGFPQNVLKPNRDLQTK